MHSGQDGLGQMKAKQESLPFAKRRRQAFCGAKKEAAAFENAI